jgi:hypothetical protein
MNSEIRNYIEIKAKFPQAEKLTEHSDLVDGDVIVNHPNCMMIATKEIIERMDKVDYAYYFRIGNVGASYICKVDI